MTFFWVFVGCVIGWTIAHKTVADECRRLGKFYVGDSTFVCTEITEKDKCGL